MTVLPPSVMPPLAVVGTTVARSARSTVALLGGKVKSVRLVNCISELSSA